MDAVIVAKTMSHHLIHSSNFHSASFPPHECHGYNLQSGRRVIHESCDIRQTNYNSHFQYDKLIFRRNGMHSRWTFRVRPFNQSPANRALFRAAFQRDFVYEISNVILFAHQNKQENRVDHTKKLRKVFRRHADSSLTMFTCAFRESDSHTHTHSHSNRK